MSLVDAADVIRALRRARSELRPQEILQSIGLDATDDKLRKAIDRRLRDLRESGLVEHDRRESTYSLAPPTDLEGAILHALEREPMTRGQLADTLSDHDVTAEHVKEALDKLQTYSRIEDVGATRKWSAEKSDDNAEPRYYLSPQEWTTRGVCFLCRKPLDDGELYLADDRTPQFGGFILVHPRCAADVPKPPNRQPACARCHLPLLPRDELPVRAVDAWDVLDDMGYAEMRVVVPVLHAVSNALQDRPTPSRFDAFSDGRPPTAEELLPLALPRDAGDGPDPSTIASARRTVFLWCLSDLSRLEQARHLAQLIHFLNDELPTGGIDPWARDVYDAALRLRALREERYLTAYGQLLTPAGEIRRLESPDWLLGQVGESRGRQWGLDEPLLGKPMQVPIVRQGDKMFHPACVTLSGEGGTRDRQTKPNQKEVRT